MGKKKAKTDEQDNLIIKPTSDLFTAVLWSAPKNEPILRDFINAVLGDIAWPPITKATVKNRFNIKEFAVDKAIVLDVQVEDESKRKFDIEVQSPCTRPFRIGCCITGRICIRPNCGSAVITQSFVR